MAVNQARRSSHQLDHSVRNIGASTTMTYHIRNSGTNDTNNTYFGFGEDAQRLVINVSAIASVTKLNGRTLSSPISLQTGGQNSFEVDVSSFELRTTGASNVEVTIR